MPSLNLNLIAHRDDARECQLIGVTDADEPICYSELLGEVLDLAAESDIRRSAVAVKDLDASPRNVSGESRPQRLSHGLLRREPPSVIAVMHRRIVGLLTLIFRAEL